MKASISAWFPRLPTKTGTKAAVSTPSSKQRAAARSAV